MCFNEVQASCGNSIPTPWTRVARRRRIRRVLIVSWRRSPATCSHHAHIHQHIVPTHTLVDRTCTTSFPAAAKGVASISARCLRRIAFTHVCCLLPQSLDLPYRIPTLIPQSAASTVCIQPHTLTLQTLESDALTWAIRRCGAETSGNLHIQHQKSHRLLPRTGDQMLVLWATRAKLRI